jgi:hypothetical protein
MQTEESIIRLSGDNIIEMIRDNRNDIIQKLFNDAALRHYLHEVHMLTEVSTIKIEFIKRSLKELILTPVDLSHYAQLILEYRKTGSVVMSRHHQKLFYEEIEKTIKSYVL